MVPSAISVPSNSCIRHLRDGAAFSLIEVTIAIGIIAFAFVTLLGMIPVGLKTFRQASDTSVGSQITQRIMNDAQQTDFNTLTTGAGATTSATPYSTRYFDDQGTELPLTDKSKALYIVNTFVTLGAVPGDTYLTDNSSSPSSLANYANLAVVSLQLTNSSLPGTPTLANGLVSRNQPVTTP